jgi:hypothetical protein
MSYEPNDPSHEIAPWLAGEYRGAPIISRKPVPPGTTGQTYIGRREDLHEIDGSPIYEAISPVPEQDNMPAQHGHEMNAGHDGPEDWAVSPIVAPARWDTPMQRADNGAAPNASDHWSRPATEAAARRAA